MNFFLEFLSNFSACDILHMYGNAAFKTSEEIKLADFAINCKVIFEDHYISSEDHEIYKHLQKVVDTIRAHQNENISSNMEELSIYCPLGEVHYNYFIKYNEYERDVKKLNIFERRITFELKHTEENMPSLIWLENALDELLNYVLRNFEDGDRVGMVIKYENCEDRRAAFSIKLKNQLRTSIIVDTLSSIIRTRSSFVTGQRMNMQVVRMRLPVFYRKLTSAGIMVCSETHSENL